MLLCRLQQGVAYHSPRWGKVGTGERAILTPTRTLPHQGGGQLLKAAPMKHLPLSAREGEGDVGNAWPRRRELD
jgi:hypothetical protein